MTPEEAVGLVADRWGLVATLTERLETERDDTFRLSAGEERFVLKVAHPADSPAHLALETEALRHAHRADPRLPLQRLRPATGGDDAVTVTTADGDRIARLFEWRPGTPLIAAAAPDDDQLVLLGDALGRLSRALRSFIHPAARYPLAWDLAQTGRLAQLQERVGSAATAAALARFRAGVEPLLHELPRQVIHNDFNPGNVLVDAGEPGYVTGILDFGDVVQSVRVADLAVALSYLIFPLGRGWDALPPFIAAFERRVPLLPTERQVLRDLVVARFAQRILVNDWLQRDAGDPRRDPDYHDGMLAALDTLL
nr:phosphotransferase [Galbitalea soli]